MNDEGETWMTPQEVAQLLGLSVTAVYSLCRRGAIPCIKIARRWRIPRRRLEEHLMGQVRPYRPALPASRPGPRRRPLRGRPKGWPDWLPTTIDGWLERVDARARS